MWLWVGVGRIEFGLEFWPLGASLQSSQRLSNLFEDATFFDLSGLGRRGMC